MSRLSLYLFGGFRALVDERALSGIYDHVRALLAYLAVEPNKGHRREVLAELLWPYESEEVARRNLRQALSRLRTALDDRERPQPLLEVDRNSIRFNPDGDCFVDVLAFQACAAGNSASSRDLPWLEKAASLYQGHFLDGFHLPDNPDFEQWQEARAEQFRLHALSQLSALAEHRESMGELAAAMEVCRQQLALEPWHEPAHAQLMRLLARSGQRHAALAQYQQCVEQLAEELGAEPEPSTQRLHQQIAGGDFRREPMESRRSAEAAGRRQVTVLYCALSEPPAMDPEDFVEIVRAFKKRCDEVAQRFQAHQADSHGGARILFFGFPHAQGDDARRALYAALRLQEEVRQLAERQRCELQLRTGAHTGLMVTAEAEADLPADLIGTPLNAAMQLRFLAEANEILVSADTERLVRAHFRLHRRQLPPAEEIRAALPGFRLEAAISPDLDERGDFYADQGNFIGREKELAQLLGLWDNTRRGQGQVLLLEGDSGIGKSRLLQAFRQRIAEQPHHLRLLRCFPDYQSSALHPVIELLNQICGFKARDSQRQRREKLAEALQRLDLYDDTALRTLGDLLQLHPDAEAAGEQGLHHQQQTLNLLAQLQRHSSRQKPLLWIVEDLHWADPSTLELIKQLAAASKDHAILMILTARPGHSPSWLKSGHCRRLILDPLPTQEVRRLVAALARHKDLPELVVDEIVTRTDGVPLFVEELTKTLLESDLLRETHHRFELSGPSPSVALPFTLQDSLMARLDRLGTAKGVAQWGAVLGREFPHALLAEVVDMDETALELELNRLLEAELLYLREDTGERIYGFRHALIQEVAYESLLRRHRQVMHQLAAEALEDQSRADRAPPPEWLAHHYTEAALFEQAVDYWLRAGHQAAALYAYNEAVSHLRRGLALLERLPEDGDRTRREFDLRIALGVPLMLCAGPVPEIEQSYARALELSESLGDEQELFPARRGLYTYYAGQGDYHTAEQLARQLLEDAGTAPEQLIEAQRTLGTTLLLRGRLGDAAERLQGALTLYDPAAHGGLSQHYGIDPGLAAFSLLAIIDWLHGAPEVARQRTAEALRMAREAAHPSTLGWCLNIALIISELDENPTHTLELAEELGYLADKHLIPLWNSWGAIMRDKAKAELTEQPASLDRLNEAFAEYDRLGAAMGRPYALALWADTCLRAGRTAQGLEIVDKALAWVERHDARLHEAELHRLKGALLLAGGQSSHTEAGLQALGRAMSIARAQGASAFELRATVSLAEHLRAWGAEEEAERLTGELLARLKRQNADWQRRNWKEWEAAQALLAAHS
ncbi:BTAD domain-containing putative transcriptional regulator [Alkalilimnicola sp. S0819]|uniref:BTAD domain-containing putative transcriptional regulator n=1 Tax=Alkalilimnicola sp. S0819 TaxID=2613922 RepID=UPI001261836D|nr:BTAD domain-containing putative transcriptional regulator [Alkalilimnicola sp. S0819]KAB7622561.1 AAA family ATPase [Alkalilimnicola sp. S0819]MPQ17448.1 AAA family ATPase [Alkalilimnicola sp. S0819]